MSQNRFRLSSLVLNAFTWLVLLVVISPAIAVAIASLETKPSYYFRFPPANPSLVWYTEIPIKYLHAAGWSLVLATIVGVLSAVLGTMAAFGIVRGSHRYRTALETYFRIPLQIPVVVTGLAFLQFYNQLAIASGIDFLGTLQGLILAHLVMGIPYSVSSAVVVLARFGPTLEEAAQSLGASHWTTFWEVTFPALKPGIFAGFFYAFVTSFGDVPISLFIAAGSKFTTLPVTVFEALQFDFEPAVLSISTLTVIGSAIFVIGMQKLVGLDLVSGSERGAVS